MKVPRIKDNAKLLALLWLLFLTRGFFYAAALPIWEGYDEPYHFAYLQHLASRHSPPSAATHLSRQVAASLHVSPLPWMLRLHAISKPVYTHDDFWKLPPEQRENLEKGFQSIPVAWAYQPAVEPPLNYEAQQPPLYYLLCWPLLYLCRDASLQSQVLFLRFAGLLFASLAIPVGYFLIKRVSSSTTMALGILGIAVVMPELYLNLFRVSNEVLALPLYSGLMYALVRMMDAPEGVWNLPAAGLLIGLGLLTKVYFLTAIPAFLVMVGWSLVRRPEHRARLSVLALFAIVMVLALAGPWYGHVHRVTGSWSGLQRENLVHGSRFATLTQIPNVNWPSGFVSILVSHIWFGAWSFLKVPKFWYLGFGAVFFLAAIGIGRIVIRSNNDPSERFALPRRRFFVLLCVFGFFCLGLLYDILLTFVSVGVSSSTGWYMYCLVIAELILLVYGLRAVLPARARRWIVPTLTWGFLVLDVYGLGFLLLPYYTGLIAHAGAPASVHPATIRDLFHFGIGHLGERLLVNKPPELAGILFVLSLFYVVGSIWLAVQSWFLSAVEASPSKLAVAGSGQGVE